MSSFYVRRSFRILPAALAFIVPVLILRGREMRWFDVAAVVLYLVNFDFGRPWFFGHLWSLSVEEQFYFLWPAVLRRCFRWRTQILLGVVALAPIYSAACYFFKVRGGGYGTFPAVADNLAIGCLLALFAPRIRRIPRILAWLMLAAIVLIPQFPADTPRRTLLMLFVLWPVMHVSIAGLVLHATQMQYWTLNWAPVVFLGKISYSLYLWQQLFFSSPQPLPIYFALPLALGFACGSYFLVEQPMLRLRDAKRENKHRVAVQLATAGD